MFVLVHSPLVGPLTWEPVADNLRRRGHAALTPELAYPTAAPFWSRHVDSVAQALTELPEVEPLVLVGHSGAGALLPATARAVAKPVAAYIFVDAGLPIGGANRLDAEGFGEVLRDLYARGERFPNWRDEELRQIVPDPAQRARLLAELRPQPLAFWEEPLPVVEGWPDAPVAYLQFTPTYDAAAEEARGLGWLYRHLQGGHFHMLVDPAAVADALLELTRSMRGLPDD